ncbi:MAG: hypothetical protein AB7V46_18920 [Thermomicrobiales bacterium]
MKANGVEQWKVFAIGEGAVVQVPRGRGEALRLHLASHGIRSRVSPVAVASFERIELESSADLDTVQTIIDQWAR